jgi:hypothetical protein
MVIRFYGYNEAGVLDAPITAGSDTGAAVEKFIFFTLTKFDYSLGSKLVEYKIEGAVPETAVGFSSNRGSIPFAQQFVGATVQDILVGQIQQQSAAEQAGDATRNNKAVTPDPADAGPAGAGLGLSGQAIAAERLRLQSIANESSFLNRIRDRL